MLFNPEMHGQLAQQRIEREIASAELLRQARPSARHAVLPPVRSATGSSAIGARLAAEPSFESARSR